MAKTKQAFPKIKFKAKVVACNAKKGSREIKLSKAELTGGLYERITDLMDEGDLIFVTLEVEQGKLFAEPGGRDEKLNQKATSTKETARK